MKAFHDFLCVLWSGKVAISLSRVFEFGFDHMHVHGWNYYVFHFGVFTVWVSDPRVGAAR
jgi:hypothetical protein